MKLLSFNISIKDDNTSEVIDFIQTNDIDIALLTESIRHIDKSTYDTYKAAIPIANTLKPSHPYEFFAPTYIADKITGGFDIDFGGKIEEGLQTISKHPIIAGDNRFYYGSYKYGFDASEFRQKDWVRSLQVSEIEIDGQVVQFFNVHGIWNETRMGDERTKKQCEYIIEQAMEKDLPTIIAGDFNLLPNSPDIALFSKHFRNLISEYKIKSTRPTFDDGLDTGDMVVDYIFVNDKIKINDLQVPHVTFSDHYPLILDFSI